jgi:hypothetical protein
MRVPLTTVFACALLIAGCSKEAPPEPEASAEPGLDPVSGLKMTGDWELVRASCSHCHSTQLVTGQRGSAEQWLTMIRWMQEKQNLQEFAPSVEQKIIKYLAENYAPNASQRRAALSPDLMPPNPYGPP